MTPTLHLFDFDGTISNKDSLFEFLKFCDLPKYKKNYLLFFAKFALAKLGILNKGKTKEQFIVSCLQHKSEKELKDLAQLFFEQQNIIRHKAKGKLFEVMRSEWDDAVMVSASLDLWLQPFAKFFGMELICTKAKFVNGKLIGFDGENCNHEQKKIRITQQIDLTKYEEVIAYGDSSGDNAMFGLANKNFYKPFA